MNRNLLLSFVLVFIFISCSDTTTVFEDSADDLQEETNAAVLANSLNFEESGVLDIYEENQITGERSRFLEEQAGTYPLSLVAQINPPTFSGADNLTASHVDLVGDYAYISYNTVDDVYAGGIDIVNVGDPARPTVTSRLYFVNADISSLKYDNGYVYAVGGVDAEQSVTATANSFVAKLQVTNGSRFNISAGVSFGFQEGFVANDVVVTPTTVLVTSGKDGFVTAYNKNDLEIINEAPFQDLRSIAVDNEKIVVLDASFGVRFLDSGLSETRQIPINADFRIADKRTLDIADNLLVVAEGDAGAGVYDVSSGALQERVPILVDPENVSPSDVVTNAAAFNEDVMLMANGGAGLAIAENTATSLDVVGVVELNGSINYVASKGDYIFAASGRSGLQIIKMNKPDASLEARCEGTPTYSGSARLTVPAGEENAYSGSRRFRTLTINGNLLLCGTWTVREEVNVGPGGVFEMRGTLIVARNNRREDITVGENGVLRVEGDLTIYGDLILEEGATLEFLGSDSRVNVFGSAEIADSASVIGEFDDVQDKF
ncbi:MAG: hypothetical protein AAF634_10130 [Bacteroidota bacterium]